MNANSRRRREADSAGLKVIVNVSAAVQRAGHTLPSYVAWSGKDFAFCLRQSRVGWVRLRDLFLPFRMQHRVPCANKTFSRAHFCSPKYFLNQELYASKRVFNSISVFTVFCSSVSAVINSELTEMLS